MEYKDLNIDLNNIDLENFEFEINNVDAFVQQNFSLLHDNPNTSNTNNHSINSNHCNNNTSTTNKTKTNTISTINHNHGSHSNNQDNSQTSNPQAYTSVPEFLDNLALNVSELVASNMRGVKSKSTSRSTGSEEGSIEDISPDNDNSSSQDPEISSNDENNGNYDKKSGKLNGKSDVDEMVLYKGRKILRSERLKQMRESQRKLRKSRVNEVSSLKLENNKLKSEIEMLKNDNSMFLSAIAKEIPNYSIGRLLQHVPPMKVSTTYVNYSTFVQAYQNKPIDKLYINGKFFIQEYVGSILNCVMAKWRVNVSHNLDLYCKSFIYMPIYGYSLYSKYIKEVEHSLKFQEIPSDWLKNDDKLPPNALSINGLVQTLMNYENLDSISLEILIAILVRYNFATAAGPTIYKSDLDKAIERSCSTDADIKFLTTDIASFEGL